MVANGPVLHKVELSWDDALSGNFPQPPAQQLFTQTVLTVAAHAKAALPEANGRVDRARDLVLAGAVVHNPDGSFTVRSQNEREKTYTVEDGTCQCPDAEKAPEGRCKHLISTWLWRKSRKVVEEQLATTALGSAGEAPQSEASQNIPERFLVTLHGKQFVTYVGLLAMAHERGLTHLSAHFISVTASLALAEAIATFADGRTFQDGADATPENVNGKIRPHFPRMALTRAKARALCAVKAA